MKQEGIGLVRLVRSAICLMLFVCGVSLLANPGEENGFSAAMGKMKQAVVPVVCFVTQAKTNDSYLISIEGTGFFITGDSRVITAGHVAQSMTSKSRIPACPTPAIYLPVDGWNTSSTRIEYIPITQCAYGNSLDIAACDLLEDPMKVSEITIKPVPAALDHTVYPDGTPVAFTGFPLNFIKPITSQGIVGTYRGDNPVLGTTELVIDKNAWPGASGSPVYESSGKIVGMIVQRGFNDASGLAFAIPGKVIRKFLDDNPPAKPQANKEQP
jgi:S1-C subfamily serine protease